MDDYTPTTKQVRGAYAAYLGGTFDERQYDRRVERFDRWLKRVKADVWDEGNSAGYREGRGGSIYSTNEDLRNPYRERVNYLKDLRD